MLDLLIVGGGPAGLATALYARRAGLHVLVAEPRATPIDKACGEGLMPPALAALRDMGVDVPGMPIRGITYRSPGHSASAPFRHGNGRGVARTVLHEALTKAAADAGVERVDRRIDTVEQRHGFVRADGIEARYVVAADGLHSAVRSSLGLAARRTPRRPRWGLRAHFACEPWTDHVEVHWAERSEAYVTPLAADRVGVAVLGSERGGFAERLARFPELTARLPREPVDRVRAAGPLRQDVTAPVCERVLLVGDAAGYVDALTGEGLAISFACARAAVECIAADEPQRYERAHARLTRRYRVLTSALLGLGAHPATRRALVPLAERAPLLMREVLGLLS